MLILAFAITVLTVLARIDMLGSYDLNTSGEEQNVVYGVIKLASKDLPLYTDPEQRPYDVIQYTPGFYYLCRGVGALTGMDPQEPRSVYLVVRWCGLVLNIVFVVLGFSMARRMGAAVPAAALGGSVLFSMLARQVHSRPDALHLVLFAGAMWLLIAPPRGQGNGSERVSLWATLLACLSVLCKQSGALALLVIGAYLILLGRWRELGRHVLFGIAVLGTAFGLLAWAYGPEVLQANIITGINNGRHVHLATWTDQNFGQVQRVVLQLIGIGGALMLLVRGAPRERALGLGILLAYAFALFTTLKHGSSPGYHSENLLLMIVLLCNTALIGRFVRWRHAVPVLSLVMLLNVRPDRLVRGASSIDELTHPVPASQAYRDATAMAAAFRNDPDLSSGLVFLDRHDHLENFLVGRSVGTQKDIICLKTSQEHYDLSGLRSDMADGSIRYIVAKGPVDELPFFGREHPEFIELGVRYGYHLYRNPGGEPVTRSGHRR
ncbi:MAG: hypothetical protein IT227_15430 [Flavobacteriales bacterium]|nr:hypothetical protein [Flavobacteriales bacterium]